ncbi:hypothetical protein N9F63_00075 [bacterium]|nr:hypothetical protein [bacterium]
MNAGRVAASTAAKPVQIMGNKALKYGAEALNSSLPLAQRAAAGLKSAYNAFGVYQLPTAVAGFTGGALNQMQGKGSVGNTLGMAEDVVNVLPGSKLLKTALTKGVTAKEGVKIGEDLTTGDYASALGRAAIGILPGDQSRINPSQVTTYGMKWGNKILDTKPQPNAQMTYGGPSAYETAMANHQARMLANPREGGEFSSERSFPVEDFLNDPAAMPPEGGATMTPGQFPDFIKQYLAKQGNMSLASSAGQSAGQFITQNSGTVDDPMAKFGLGEALGGAASGAYNPVARSFGIPGMALGAITGLATAKYKSDVEKNRFIAEEERLSGMRTASNVANAQDFSRQALSTYDQDGAGGGYYSTYGGPVDRFYMGGATQRKYAMGGPIDYETEKEEVILASPYDRPVAPGQGSYNQLSENLFKGNGPSHAQGGIPTRGGTQPFVDGQGEPVDSPYVFSDSKDMRFDPNDILSMIT